MNEQASKISELTKIRKHPMYAQIRDALIIKLHNKEIEKIADISTNLSPREAKIIEMRYGLNGYQISSLEDIAKEFDFSPARARQIQAKALYRIIEEIIDKDVNYSDDENFCVEEYKNDDKIGPKIN